MNVLGSTSEHEAPALYGVDKTHTMDTAAQTCTEKSIQRYNIRSLPITHSNDTDDNSNEMAFMYTYSCQSTPCIAIHIIHTSGVHTKVICASFSSLFLGFWFHAT